MLEISTMAAEHTTKRNMTTSYDEGCSIIAVRGLSFVLKMSPPA
jgi:hypothetical protein